LADIANGFSPETRKAQMAKVKLMFQQQRKDLAEALGHFDLPNNTVTPNHPKAM